MNNILGYQILVHEDRKDSEDWLNRCSKNCDYIWNNKIFLNENEAKNKIEWLKENEKYKSHGGFDIGKLSYKLQTVNIE